MHACMGMKPTNPDMALGTRLLAIGLGSLLTTAATAQLLVSLTGQVLPCNGTSYAITIVSLPGMQPPVNSSTTTGGNCTFSFSTATSTQSSGFVVSFSCDGGITFLTDTVYYNTGLFGFDSVSVALQCGNVYDCLGILNGPNVAGTACDDNDPNTTNDIWDVSCNCVGSLPNAPPNDMCLTAVNIIADSLSCIPLAGSVDNANQSMQAANCAGFISPVANDVWYHFYASTASVLIQANATGGVLGGLDIVLEVFEGTCNALVSVACSDSSVTAGGNEAVLLTTTPGMHYYYRIYHWGQQMPAVGGFTTCVTYGNDCLGVPGGTNQPGTPCNDNDPNTVNDTWDANCTCAGTIPLPCQADFMVVQGYTIDSLNGNVPVPIPNELWLWNLSHGGSGNYSFVWDFGDGTSSTDAYPTHIYPNGGPYLLCLTLDDGAGCTSTYCDSISVDANGIYQGMAGQPVDRAAMTLNVIDPIISHVSEQPALTGLALWPNPVTDELNMSLSSDLSGRIPASVIDMSGRCVLATFRTLSSGSNRFTIPTEALDPGVYLLHIGNDRNALNQRFVKNP